MLKCFAAIFFEGGNEMNMLAKQAHTKMLREKTLKVLLLDAYERLLRKNIDFN